MRALALFAAPLVLLLSALLLGARPGHAAAAPTIATALSAGSWHTCVITDAGGLKCWGDNINGQLGDGTPTDRLTPIDVMGLASGVAGVGTGGSHTCALAAGNLTCWGRNEAGQLGDGTIIEHPQPMAVTGLSSPVATIAAGGDHTCALTAMGGLLCWGDNSFGQVGDGTTTDQPAPVAVAGLASGVAAVSVGAYHTCVLTTGGGVKCWGDNLFGQVGDGTTDERDTPVDVSGLGSGVTAISAGGNHTCALMTAGALMCWGDNSFGELGAPISESCGTLGFPCSTTPIRVSGLASGVSGVAAGSDHTCAVTNAHTVKCWGDNTYGQLGDGTTTEGDAPVDVAGLSTVSAVSAGEFHSCALTAAGAVKCWGDNEFGQLGDGQHCGMSCATPVDVSGFQVSTPTPTPTPVGIVGDVNCDGTTNTIDAALILQYNAGLVTSLPCQQHADVNRDHTINPVDAALILQYDAGLLAHWPP